MSEWTWPFQCTQCERSYPSEGVPYRCEHCGGIYDFVEPLVYNPDPLSKSFSGLGSYHRTFPLPPGAQWVSLGEGGTPLIEEQIEGRSVFFKSEQNNPTGSFKDRGTAVLVSALLAMGVDGAVEDSSGNAGASFAAYCARGGMRARVFVPSYASGPKRSQIEAYGAEVIPVPGPRSAATNAVLDEVGEGAVYGSHAYLPFVLAGMATVAFEIVEAMGQVPGAVITPVGQGSLLIGMHRGFKALLEAGEIDRLPAMVGVQALACAPIWISFTKKGNSDEISEGETVAEGIRILNPHRIEAVVEAIGETSGMMVAVDEESIRQGRSELGQRGHYVEPTSAVIWPALTPALEAYSGPIVAVLTGSGFKDVRL